MSELPLDERARVIQAGEVPATTRIGLLLFDDVEVLDACGPFEVFSVAGRVARRRGEPAPFDVVTLSAEPTTTVRARGGGAPWGLRRGAGRGARRRGEPAPFDVVTLSAEPTTTVRARGGLPIVADRLLADAPPLDLAVVPGGVTTRIEGDPAVLAWI